VNIYILFEKAPRTQQINKGVFSSRSLAEWHGRRLLQDCRYDDFEFNLDGMTPSTTPYLYVDEYAVDYEICS